MNRSQLEHIIRACAAITHDDEFIVIGSQAVLGAHPDAPEVLLRSMDLDLYPKNHPEDSVVVDRAIGEGSTFHQTFGYYAHGVGPETATLPNGWQTRLVPVRNDNTKDATGWCLDPADLAVSKLVAGREHDLVFVQQLLAHGMIAIATIHSRLEGTPLPPEKRTRVSELLQRLE